MIKFGFSAYLKLLALNDRPKNSELRRRLSPAGDGYDFHKSLRRLASQLVHENESVESLRTSIERIARTAEKKSAVEGLTKLAEWRSINAGEITVAATANFVSPKNLFSVTYQPNFCIKIAGQKVATHIWNTKTPKLTDRDAQGGMALFSDLYHPTYQLATLCLRTGKLFVLRRDAHTTQLANNLVKDIERRILEIHDDDGDRRRPPDGPPIHPTL